MTVRAFVIGFFSAWVLNSCAQFGVDSVTTPICEAIPLGQLIELPKFYSVESESCEYIDPYAGL